jgi:microcystin-dependent protein
MANSALGQYLIINVPPGVMVDYGGTTAPTGWLLCYGQAISRTTYADLFTAVSTNYGVGDGSTTFNVPDCRGRVLAGKDDMGGSSANRLTNQSGGLNGDTIGATGGAETHTLVTAELASHSHTGTTNESLAQSGGGAAWGSGAPANLVAQATFTTATTGSGTAHNNVQPTIIAAKIIKV